MLRANVGVSRKTSKDYNSRGFMLNLEGEINAALDDPEAVIERIKELYSVAEEALDRQVAEAEEIDRIASRDAEGPPRPPSNGHSNGHANGEPARNGHRESRPTDPEPATNKQVQFLQTLAKRRKLFGAKLEDFIEEIAGRRCSPYDLTKKEAGAVINALNPEASGDDRARR
ncbi:hypothetical protein [Paludisphaera sp.]|uniref:hypothetical protein n=1 Tax=Paludisphaera sp. TaxID=2017432 RepID=UPI00301C1C96